MPDSKISALPSATVPLAGTEVLPIVQSSTTDKVTAADLLRQNGQTVTTSNPVLSLAQTWNAGGVTFTGMQLAITDTASASGSLLLDLKVGGVTVFAVGKTGGFSTVASSMGIYNNSAAIYMGGSGDVVLARDAANTLALRNSTNAQRFNIYNTFTDSSNYERAAAAWSGNIFYVGTEKGGTGASRAVRFLVGGTAVWDFNTAGHFLAVTDNVNDIGASGANRPRSGFFGTNLTVGNTINCAALNVSTGAAGILVGNQVYILTTASGVLLLQNQTANDFSRLQFGGTTSSFPAIKRNGATFDFRLADDSNYCSIAASSLGLSNAMSIYGASAIPAGGSTGAGYKLSSTANFGVFFGSGAPTLSAAKGSLYLRSDGSGATDRFYINTDGGTTWTAGTTVL